MTPRPLPDSPNLEQLKKQAKSLLRDAHAGDGDALARFSALPAFQSSRQPLDGAALALHDAQSVLAREHGFVSWNALREEVEARTLSFSDGVDAFVRAASDGAPDRAKRLLGLFPSIANATLQAELLLGDAVAVAKRLAADPHLATTPGGPSGGIHCSTCATLACTGNTRNGWMACSSSRGNCCPSARIRTPNTRGTGILSCHALRCGLR